MIINSSSHRILFSSRFLSFSSFWSTFRIMSLSCSSRKERFRSCPACSIGPSVYTQTIKPANARCDDVTCRESEGTTWPFKALRVCYVPLMFGLRFFWHDHSLNLRFGKLPGSLQFSSCNHRRSVSLAWQGNYNQQSLSCRRKPKQRQTPGDTGFSQ